MSGVNPYQMLTLPAISSQVSSALSNAFAFLTTIALVGFMLAHLRKNT
ncbi:MAG: hypothetical protein QXH75_05405 [Sulfolobaceae archaeon]